MKRMGFDERCREFALAQTNAQMVYMEAEREIVLMVKEVEELRGKIRRQADEIDRMRKALERANSEDGPWKQRAESLDDENAALRCAVADAIIVQRVRCGDADMSYCREKCPLHRRESDDCLACDVLDVAAKLGIEVE